MGEVPAAGSVRPVRGRLLPPRGDDGKQHEGFADYDAERTKVLESRGIRIIRFANAEVEGDLDSVHMRIREALRLPFE